MDRTFNQHAECSAQMQDESAGPSAPSTKCIVALPNSTPSVIMGVKPKERSVPAGLSLMSRNAHIFKNTSPHFSLSGWGSICGSTAGDSSVRRSGSRPGNGLYGSRSGTGTSGVLGVSSGGNGRIGGSAAGNTYIQNLPCRVQGNCHTMAPVTHTFGAVKDSQGAHRSL